MSHVCHDYVTCASWLCHMCIMVMSHVYHGYVTCVSWLCHMYIMVMSHVHHGYVTCVSWSCHIYMYIMVSDYQYGQGAVSRHPFITKSTSTCLTFSVTIN